MKKETDQQERTWEQLSRGEKKHSLSTTLLVMELGHADPPFTQWYVETKAAVRDPADSMRVDQFLFERVITLRQEGKLRPAEELRQHADSLLDLSAGEMQQALNDYARQLEPSSQQ